MPSAPAAARRKRTIRPFFRFTLLGLVFVAVAAGLLLRFSPLPPIAVYFLTLSACAFVLCGYDKLAAGSTATRVPENVLFGVALLGGTPGLLLGMNVFRHKTRKLSFQLGFAVVLIAQAGLAYWWITTAA